MDLRPYEQSLCASAHLATVVGLMFDDGIDVVVASGETDHGIPFNLTLTVGRYSQHGHADGLSFAEAVDDERARLRREARGN